MSLGPMPDAFPVDPSVARARLRGKRAALLFILALAVFIIASAVLEIAPAVFGVRIRPVSDRTCAQGVQALARALDRARPSAGGPTFAGALEPEWRDADATFAACARTSEGLDAWASLLRLREGEQQLAGGPDGDLAALRRDVGAHLPADLR